MTITETRPHAQVATDGSAPPDVFDVEPRGVADWVTTTDHRTIGKMFITSGLVFSVGSLILAALAGFERIDPTAVAIFDRTTDADQVTGLATWGIMFLGVLPTLLGLAIAVVPSQVGAENIAFPRAAALSFWAWLIGSGTVIGTVVANGGPGGGEAKAVQLFLLALGMVALALIVAAVCIATTVLALRAPRLRIDRVPFFSFASLVQSTLLILVLPVLIMNLIYLYVDHRYGRVAFGGNQGIALYLNWVVRQPTSFLLVIPVLGVIADVIPVFAKHRQRLSGALQIAIGIAGVASFGAFAQDAVWDKVTTQFTFIAVAFLALVPVIVLLAVTGITLAEGTLSLKAPAAWSLIAGLFALAAAAAGALTPLKGLDLLKTTYEQVPFDLAVSVGLMGAIAGLFYWAPRLWGRVLPDRPAVGLGALALIATLLVSVPNIIAGFIDQPRYSVAFRKADGTAVLNSLTSAGYVLWALVLVAVLGLLAQSTLTTTEPAPADPWDGHTLEWTSESLEVRSDRPLLDAKEAGR